MKEALIDDRLSVLEARHRALHDAVSRLERRAFLTPEEQREITDLKKRKLLAKDQLFALRRTL
ncbi:MAG: YdcH family protein [Polyangiaceae bacterium]|nr:YdcH family protein [Polyangiaceae bacterium]